MSIISDKPLFIDSMVYALFNRVNYTVFQIPCTHINVFPSKFPGYRGLWWGF